MEKLEHLKIPLQEIKLATNNFGSDNFLGQGGFGPVYKGELSHSKHPRNVAIKRLDLKGGQGQREFLTEILMLASYRHKNLASLVGFCDEDVEKILVYELEVRGSLDTYLGRMDLTWTQRLKICLGAAQGLNYLHNGVGFEHRVIHRDVKSSNVLLDENWEAKVSDFGLSKVGTANQQFTFLISNPCGTLGYVDPEYLKTGILTKESDVYSFGVLLFEVLCGRPACMFNYEDERRFLARLAQLHYEQGRLDEIINPNLREQMNPDSLSSFSTTAYHCLREKRSERPNMDLIVVELEKALEHQLGDNFICIGKWGGPGGTFWSYHLESHHNLKKITIDHEDWIYSLVFATEDSNGKLHHSKKFGGDGGPSKGRISEINFDADEKITGISGTVGVTTGKYYGITVISSLSFITNKTTHGPFGEAKGAGFSVRDKGAFAGIYGRAGFYMDSIGFYFSLC